MISLHEGRGSKARKPAEKVFALKLTVAGTDPRVWRKLVVRESMWLSRLHDAIQVIFDWYDYQSHVFSLDDLRLGNPSKRDDHVVEDDRDVTLADLDLAHRERLEYEYLFGEGWKVDIRVEVSGTVKKGVRYPACAAGERAGPPEDCGGLDAFHDMIACLREKDTELGREWAEWIGPEYDPEACDLERINTALRKLGR